MNNPVLVEITRGERVESRHRGAVAVSDAHGKAVLALGDVEAPVFPRSAVKIMQALPLLESGAAEAFSFHAQELALAQASHSGEPEHVAGVTAMLTAIGLGEPALECGSQQPVNAKASAAMIKSGRAPSQLHNNCSGKHAGFLAVARQLGVDHHGYVGPHHPVQELVRKALADVTGAALDAKHCGIDGCSIPAYAIPLNRLAAGFARMATGVELPRERAEAARRLYQAGVTEPFFVAGSGRFDTEAMILLKGAALIKGGAEGVHCAAIPELGLGVAVKCDDGAGRASEAAITAVLARLLSHHADALRRWTAQPIQTRRGMQAGEIRAVTDILKRLS
jgi:L-asparaginase II